MKSLKIFGNKGFTLIETLIVVALIAIMVAIASPSFVRQARNTNLREAARDFSSDVAYWRQRAVSENVHYRIEINSSTNSYKIQKATISQPTVDDYADLIPSVTKSFSNKSKSVKFLSTTFGGSPPRITIQPRGTMPPGGTVTLKHDLIANSKAEIVINVMGRVKVK